LWVPEANRFHLRKTRCALSSAKWGVEEPTVKVAFEIGETVRVVSGPFENLDGIVQEVSPERGRLRVQVSMFEREIPVELDFADVEKY
jgi:transcriptional antiterminator NusG